MPVQKRLPAKVKVSAPKKLRTQLNTENVTGLHKDVWGDFRNLRGNVAPLSGDISGLRGRIWRVYGNATGVTGDVTEYFGHIDWLPDSTPEKRRRLMEAMPYAEPPSEE